MKIEWEQGGVKFRLNGRFRERLDHGMQMPLTQHEIDCLTIVAKIEELKKTCDCVNISTATSGTTIGLSNYDPDSHRYKRGPTLIEALDAEETD